METKESEQKLICSGKLFCRAFNLDEERTGNNEEQVSGNISTPTKINIDKSLATFGQ